ncbi:MAG TPA: hypothetical protein ENH10_04005 [Bacteroidetes bacterium]|nr:LPS-assembly protein LptD [bacterium BMS3Bbin04]HDO65182.1 hypothetical protein [Bacteroidota bacterium]HEX04307.1 hypothetical protein [Bacteroidota bacterium]
MNMNLQKWLALFVLLMAFFFNLALGQDSTNTKPVPPPEHTINKSAMEHQRGLAKKQAEDERRQQLENADSLASKTVLMDDRGDYHGYGRDTGGAIILKRAAELQQIQDLTGEVVQLEGNVKIVQDSMTIWCDQSRHRRAEGILELYGDVVMIDPQRKLMADEVFYYESTRLSIARGNVIIERDSVVLNCEQGQYDEVNDIATFDRNVIGHDLRRDIIVTGDNGTFFTELQHTIIPTNPVLVQMDSLGQEETRIVGEYMEYDALGGLAFVRDSVKISWRDVEGWGDELFYYPDSNRALLVGEPRILHFRDEVFGDSVWIYMNEETLDSVVVIGNSIAYTASDSSEFAPRSTLRGRRIVLTFDDGAVNQMASFGQAVGVYHVFQDGIDQGSNKVSGDLVELNIEERTLQSVRVIGGTEGTFYPPHLAGKLRDD